MRRSRTPVLLLIAALVALALAVPSYSATVSVDVATKIATSDVTSLDTKGLRVKGEQVGVFVRNMTLAPQEFTLKVSGLTAESYDVYVNQAFAYTKPASAFAAGVEYTVDGRVVDDGMVGCLTLTKDTAQAAYDKWIASEDAEAKRVCYTLSQVREWCTSALGRDQAWRSVSIILAPSGRMLQSMTWMTRESDIDTARAVTRACWLVQQARDRMYDNIRDADLRNEAVVSMTPVSFTAHYTIKNGKPHIDAKLANKCDLPISGAISFALPQGWKTTAKGLSFKDLKCGKTSSLSFDLIAPSKAAAPPESVPIAAVVKLVQDEFAASCKLKVVAKSDRK